MVACAALFYNSPVTHANCEKCLKVMLALSEEACRAETETTYQPLPLTLFELSRFLRNGMSQRYSFAPFAAIQARMFALAEQADSPSPWLNAADVTQDIILGCSASSEECRCRTVVMGSQLKSDRGVLDSSTSNKEGNLGAFKQTRSGYLWALMRSARLHCAERCTDTLISLCYTVSAFTFLVQCGVAQDPCALRCLPFELLWDCV